MHTTGVERRSDSHRQHMVDVALVLQRAYGSGYATAFLREMNIPEAVIGRLLAAAAMRRPAHAGGPPR